MTEPQPILRELVGEDLWDVSWSHDGAYLAVLTFDSVLLLDSTGQQLHALSHGESRVLAHAWSPNRHTLVTACDDGTLWICVLQEGQFRRVHPLKSHTGPVRALSWSPDGTRMASGGDDKRICLWNMDPGTLERAFNASAEIRCLRWSPDGKHLLLADSMGEASFRSPINGQMTHRLQKNGATARSLCWSPRSDFAVLAFGDGILRCYELDGGNWVEEISTLDRNLSTLVWDWKEQSIAGHSGTINAVAWHPKDTHVASAGDDWQVHVWSVQTQQHAKLPETQPKELVLQQAFDGFQSKVTGLSWSPDGSRLACVSLDGTLQIHSIAPAQAVHPYVSMQAATLGRRAAREPRAASLSRWFQRLPVILVQLQHLGIFPSLSWVEALLRLTSGSDSQDALPLLKQHPGIQAVAALQWPPESRVGFIALLLREVPCAPEWQPPPELTPGALVQGLQTALSGEEMVPEAPPLLESAVARNAGLLDEPFLRLLMLLGPQVLAEEPGLVLRLRTQLAHVRPDSLPPRRLLGLRSRIAHSGLAAGQGGEGDRMGLELRGPLTQLVPWQLVLPPPLLRYRQREGALLYRARAHSEPPRRRPLLLVLDVSPAVFGPVEQLTRLAAHRIARTWLDAHVAVSLLIPGTSPALRPVLRESELASIWTRRTLSPLDAEDVLSLAHDVRPSLQAGELEPLTIVLTHAWFGAESSRRTPLPGTHALFIRLPGRRGTPPLAPRCERWEMVSTAQPERLEEAVSRLLG